MRRLLALGLAGVALMTGCTNDDGGRERAAADDSEVEALGHVHGLGTDPGDGTLYAATHYGVLRVGDDGSLSRVADRWQDTMAFTVVGPGHFLASGHPDLREELPSHLGLIESEDAAETWRTLSLGGKADFHALDLTGDRVYGYDALSGQLLTSTDRTRWAVVARAPVVDLAANPTDENRVVASTGDGVLTVYDLKAGGEAVVLENAPPVILLDWPARDYLVGVTTGGQVYRSQNAGHSWTSTTHVPGSPEALDVTQQVWHVATTEGIYRSADDGQSWQEVVAHD